MSSNACCSARLAERSPAALALASEVEREEESGGGAHGGTASTALVTGAALEKGAALLTIGWLGAGGRWTYTRSTRGARNAPYKPAPTMPPTTKLVTNCSERNLGNPCGEGVPLATAGAPMLRDKRAAMRRVASSSGTATSARSRASSSSKFSIVPLGGRAPGAALPRIARVPNAGVNRPC